MTSSSPSAWTVGTVVGLIARDVRARPVGVCLALVVVPSAWYAPADLLATWVAPPDAHRATFSSFALQLSVLMVTAIWSCVTYGGQLRIALLIARGRPIDWSQFHRGVSNTAKLAASTLPFMLPLGALALLPAGDWVDNWAILLLPCAVGLAVALTAPTVLWAPLMTDRRLPLLTALSASWQSTRGHVWRLVGLGLTVAATLGPLLAFESIIFGRTWVSGGILGGLYALATAHVYELIAPPPTKAPSGPPYAQGLVPPDAGSGWSKPYL